MLLFHVGAESYALETHSIIEIIHRVELSQVYGMPAAIAGRFNYHGQIVPVLDLSQLLGGRPSRPALGTRIIVVQSQLAEPIAENDRAAKQTVFGLLAEQVAETIEISQQALDAEKTDGYRHSHAGQAYFGKALLHQQKMVQCLHTEKLLDELHHSLLTKAASL